MDLQTTIILLGLGSIFIWIGVRWFTGKAHDWRLRGSSMLDPIKIPHRLGKIFGIISIWFGGLLILYYLNTAFFNCQFKFVSCIK